MYSKYDDYSHEAHRFFRITLLLMAIALCVVPVAISGCDTPHPKSAAEIRKEKADARQQQIQARRNKDAQERIKRAQARAKMLAMPRTPPGIMQMDPTHFYVKSGFEGNTRDLCRTSEDGSPAGINSIVAAPNGSKDMIIDCNNPEHEYRHEPFTTTTTTTPAPAPAGK